MLGNNAILKEYRNGNIVIKPFNINQLGSNSYDVRLGDCIYREKGTSPLFELNLPPCNLTEGSIWADAPEIYSDGFVIHKGEFILATTIEAVGGRKNISTLLKNRSTIERQGLQVCASAGFGDVGYTSKWTLEIKNISNTDIYIPINIRIAQISFFYVKGVNIQYKGAYQSQGEWKFEDMLPKLGKGRF